MSHDVSGRVAQCLEHWTSNRKVAVSNPRTDKVQICRSAPEQAVNVLFLGYH
jgi:hypothetical protein